jgi:hypothetical protein
MRVPVRVFGSEKIVAEMDDQVAALAEGVPAGVGTRGFVRIGPSRSS